MSESNEIVEQIAAQKGVTGSRARKEKLRLRDEDAPRAKRSKRPEPASARTGLDKVTGKAKTSSPTAGRKVVEGFDHSVEEEEADGPRTLNLGE